MLGMDMGLGFWFLLGYKIYILRLRATGVIDVENPVSAATHEGSSEEIE